MLPRLHMYLTSEFDFLLTFFEAFPSRETADVSSAWALKYNMPHDASNVTLMGRYDAMITIGIRFQQTTNG